MYRAANKIGDAFSEFVGTAAQGSPTDAVVRAIVNTVPTTDYNQGDLVSVDGNAAGEDDCILMIPGPDYDAP